MSEWKKWGGPLDEKSAEWFVNRVEKFSKHAAATQQEKGYAQVTRWYFSKQRFTQGAKELLRDEGIFHSDLGEFNGLANLFGFLGLRF